MESTKLKHSGLINKQDLRHLSDELTNLKDTRDDLLSISKMDHSEDLSEVSSSLLSLYDGVTNQLKEIHSILSQDYRCAIFSDLEKLVSKEFDTPQEVPKKEKKKYIPPMDHPWRKNSFANYAAKQKHRCGANV